jgi:hypothetical protein
MYYCYLRAKRNELLAIRDSAGKIQNSQISIILEPVRPNITELLTCVNEIINDDYRGNLIYILNPTIGDLANNNQLVIQQASRLVEEQPSIIFGIIVTNGTDITEIEYWRNIFPNSRFVLIHKGELNINYASIINNMPYIIENIFYSNRVSSLYVNKFIKNKVILEDCFNRLNRNADYQHNIIEFFSDRHLNFTQHGLQGFANFSTIGDYYADGGAQPYTTAFHLTFPDQQGVILIQHCLSDPREYREETSIQKEELLEDIYTTIMNRQDILRWSTACQDLVRYYDSAHYSFSLGTLKRLSIRHHFELMDYLKTQGIY